MMQIILLDFKIKIMDVLFYSFFLRIQNTDQLSLELELKLEVSLTYER